MGFTAGRIESEATANPILSGSSQALGLKLQVPSYKLQVLSSKLSVPDSSHILFSGTLFNSPDYSNLF
jgi:hypothetical protein